MSQTMMQNCLEFLECGAVSGRWSVTHEHINADSNDDLTTATRRPAALLLAQAYTRLSFSHYKNVFFVHGSKK